MAFELDGQAHQSLIHTHIIRQHHVYNLAYRQVVSVFDWSSIPP